MDCQAKMFFLTHVDEDYADFIHCDRSNATRFYVYVHVILHSS